MFNLNLCVQTVLFDNIFVLADRYKMIVLSSLLAVICCVVISLIAYMLFRMRQYRVNKSGWKECKAHFDLLEQIDTAVMLLPADDMNDIAKPSTYIYINAAASMFLKALNTSSKGETDAKSIKRFRGDLLTTKKEGRAEELRMGRFKDGTNYTLYFSGKKIKALNQECLLITLVQLDEYQSVIRRQLHAANETLDFIQNISQYISQPLNDLLQRIETLLNTKNIAHKDGIIRALEEQNKKLQHTVNSIIDFSMLEYGKDNIKCYYHNVLTNIQAGIEAMERLAKQYPDVELVISQPYSALELDIDDVCIPACWTIFIENAIHHAGKGKIEAGICYENGEFIAYCSDNGPGIPQQLQVSIFEQFATYGKTNSHGVGMGLAMNKSMARIFKGLTGVVSAPGAGSLFWIQLPLKGHAELRDNANLASAYSLLQNRNKGVWFDATSGREMVVRGVQKGGPK